MNTDAFFVMGRQHTVCQDYALAKGDRVVLSDGCSASPHTDIGARLLCHTALRHPPAQALKEAQEMLDPLGLPTQALDATLFIAHVDDDEVRVHLQGDGVWVARGRGGVFFRDQKVSLVQSINFPSGAPLYPSYSLSPGRKRAYVEEFGLAMQVETYNVPGGFVGMNAGDFVTLDWTFSRAAFDLVLLFSDGVQSFKRSDANGVSISVPLPEIVERFMDFKGYAGQFLQRRAKRFLKDAHADGIHHDDDFSVAGIYLGELP